MSDIKLPRATAKGRPEIVNVNAFISGAKGSGKTSFVEEVLLAKKRRLLILDTLAGEYGNPAFCQATGIRYDAVVDDIQEFWKVFSKLAGDGSFRVVARCPGHEQEILKLIEYDQHKKRSILTNAVVVVEEITFFMDSHEIEPSILSHLQYGRHNRNCLVGISRSPYEVHPRFREQMDFVIAFHQSEERALQFFRAMNTDAAGELAGLERGDYRLIKGESKDFVEWIGEE